MLSSPPATFTSGVSYCHTLENKSSSPPKPPDDLAGALPAVVVVDGPVLLDQPPNSSSAATLGAGLNPPPAPGTIGVCAKELVLLPPHPKSFEAATGAGLFCAGAAGGLVGAAEAHSLPPQISAPEAMPLVTTALCPEAERAAGLFCGGDERLKTEFEDTCEAGLMGGGEL